MRFRLSTAGFVVLAVAFALVLRVSRLGAGLPEFLDEALPFRHALGMWNAATGAADLNPHFYRYPSLSLYAFLLLQAVQMAVMKAAGVIAGTADYLLAFRVDASPMVLVARALCVALDAVTVAVVVVTGERMRRGVGLVAGLVVACAPTMIVMTRSIYTETFFATFTILALERMLAWRRLGGHGRLVAAVALIGLAAGAKYPGAALLLPLGVALVQRDGRRGLAWWPACAAGAGFVFLLTTPYALLDRAAFVHDLVAVGRMTSEGHFGNFERVAAPFFARQLAAELGWPTVLFLAAAVVITVLDLVRRRSRLDPSDDRLVLVLALLVIGGPVALARVETVRYLVPVLPVVALLAADAALAMAARETPRARMVAALAVAPLLMLPVLPGAWFAARSRGEVTRIDAERWLLKHVGQDQLIVQELHAAPLLDREEMVRVRDLPEYAHASARWRNAFDREPWRAVVALPLLTVGHVTSPVRGADGQVQALEVVAQAADLNAAVYDPRLLAGVDYVVTSGNIRDRFAGESNRYTVPMAFYALLDSTAHAAARFAPIAEQDGPEITVYALTPRTQRAVAALGALDSLWWTTVITPDYASNFARVTGVASDPRSPTDAHGEPAPWVASLAPVFADRWSSFAQTLAFELGVHRRNVPARALARAVLMMEPADIGSCLTYTVASRRLGAWADARRMLERTFVALARTGDVPPPAARLEHADLLAATGDRAWARALYDSLAHEPDAALSALARDRLRALR